MSLFAFFSKKKMAKKKHNSLSKKLCKYKRVKIMDRDELVQKCDATFGWLVGHMVQRYVRVGLVVFRQQMIMCREQSSTVNLENETIFFKLQKIEKKRKISKKIKKPKTH